MILSEKLKIDFEKWILDNYWSVMDIQKFWQIPQSMQYGVYVDFFDSVGIIIYIKPLKSGEWKCYIGDNTFVSETRQKARTKAIEKVNEFYNKL
jgi:hypothetical protein